MAVYQCSVCGGKKSRDDFRWNSRFGLRGECKVCEQTVLRCSGCESLKRHDCFPPSKKMSTGRHSLCCDCHALRMKQKYHNSEEHRKRHKEYGRSEAVRQWGREYNSRPEVKARARSRDRQRYLKAKESPAERAKNRARQRANYALKKGTLVRPQRCQAGGKYGPGCVGGPVSMHHHKGYAPEYALDVEWLCGWCHGVADMRCRDDGTSSVTPPT